MRTVTAAAVVLLLVTTVSARQQRSQDVELQAAIRTATVDGDLEKAAKLFAAIADTYKADRATAATALLHLADVYQKRGDAQARSTYARILREFPDQDAANTARARIGTMSRSGGEMSYRRLWIEHSGSEDYTSGTVSADGRHLAFVDWDGGDLMVRDLTNNTSRRLTGDGKWPPSGEYAERSAISRDGTLIAYSWYDGTDRYQLRVGDLRGASLRPRTVLDVPDVTWLAPHDWSPDGRFVAATLTRRNRQTELVLIKIAERSVRTIKATDWAGTSHACFSPDGRFLAYDVAVRSVGIDDRDVAVMSLADGKEVVVASHAGLDRVAAWSHDGELLLFTSERGGGLGLWSQPMDKGAPRARTAPRLLKGDIGAKTLGITMHGSLYSAQQVEGRNILVAEVDFKTGAILAPPVRAPGRYVDMNEWPDWSRDGRFLSHVYARNWSGRSPSIAITALDGSGAREIPVSVNNGGAPLWSPDGQSFVTHGVSADGRSGIYRIDARDGAARLLVEAMPGVSYGHPEYSPDGRRVYFTRSAVDDRAIVEYDMGSGHLREVLRGPGLTLPAVSPDGRKVATVRQDGKSSVVLVASLVDGGEAREIIRVARPQRFGFSVSWAPDSEALLLNTTWVGEERKETWLVPLTGPHKVLDLPTGALWGRIRVHPDGRRLAYQTGSLRYEMWVLENFLPAK